MYKGHGDISNNISLLSLIIILLFASLSEYYYSDTVYYTEASDDKNNNYLLRIKETHRIRDETHTSNQDACLSFSKLITCKWKINLKNESWEPEKGTYS